jgi:hypothetical protein
MSQDLLDYPVFVNETQDLRQSTAVAAKKRVHLPDFFNALCPFGKPAYLAKTVCAKM